MRVVHVIEGLPRTAGTTVFPIEVAREQLALGHEVEIVHFTFNDCADSGVRIRRVESLDELGYCPDIVHIHAFWSLCQVRAMRWCRQNGVPYVVSPHGGLMPRVLRKGWLKKHLFFWVFVKSALAKAVALHCTGEGERTAVEALGIRTRTFTVPLGCRLPVGSEVKVKGEGEQRMVLFLGRLGEEKGLELLLEAWKEIQTTSGKLVLAGPSWQGYGEKLREKVEVEKIGGVEFAGPADEAMKDRLYRAADVFVLSSPMENFSLVVLEALAYGVPVICTKGTPWKGIAEQDCGWWIDYTRESFVRALKDALEASDEKLGEMGARARALAGTYDWRRVAERLTGLYLNRAEGACS